VVIISHQHSPFAYRGSKNTPIPPLSERRRFALNTPKKKRFSLGVSLLIRYLLEFTFYSIQGNSPIDGFTIRGLQADNSETYLQ
jgi:hypothetical protein